MKMCACLSVIERFVIRVCHRFFHRQIFRRDDITGGGIIWNNAKNKWKNLFEFLIFFK